MVAEGGAVRRARTVAVGLVLVAALASCSSGGTGSEADPGPEGDAAWIAAELPQVPDGMLVCQVDEHSSIGRRVAYGSIAEGVGDNCEVTVTASTSFYGLSLADAIAMAEANLVAPPTGTEVNGHPAMVGPMTDEGRTYGYRVGWEQAPGLVVMVEDARYVDGEPVATEESALDLASQVVGMDRARWDEAVVAYDASYEYSGPPDDATQEVLATGEVDGRPWTLSAWVAPDRSGVSDFRCLGLQHAGEDTGPGCATEWEVLGGTGFVIGWSGADGEPTVRSGVSAAPVSGGEAGLTPVAAQTFPVEGAGARVWVAVVPTGACTVVVGDAPRAGASPRQLWLLPGDPGAAECAGG